MAWQARTPILPGVSSITFESSEGPSAGEDIAVELRYPGIEVLAEASTQLQRQLQNYPQLRNIVNPYTSGKPQIDLHLLDEARRLGLSSKDIAQQLRASFYGAEAVREQRGRHELRVMVRLPKSQRRSEHDLDTLKVRTAQGGDVPLHYVARLDRGQAPTAISRYDGQRTVTVSAEFAAWVKSPDEALETLEQAVFQPLLAQFPGLEIAMVGAQREQGESFAALSQGYAFALFVIFALLAVAFRSYVQPIIVMAVIPFGFVGAVWGHVVMGYGLSITSVIGLIAVSGVVVNDSLILIDATNRERRRGRGALDAAIEGGAMRLRAILLTSLTTFCGLMPMLTETSVQARFLIPMAISLGFGIVAATIVVLVIVPALYMIVEDLREIAG
ncbi:MAG: efflux RND transporter permease subunit [Nannocystaceae bacterium]